MAQRVHLPNFSTLPQCALLAIAERRSQLARAVANRFAVEKVYSSHLELAADAEIDAVAVSANYAQQGEIAVDLLKAGKHVFMKKPMAVSVRLETATSKFHGWDEQTQIYFEGGWLSEQIYKKYLGIT